MQAYSNPKRESEPFALPDLEIFHNPDDMLGEKLVGDEGDELPEGWYYWYCSPGCLPEGEIPFGPFDSEEEALENAQENAWED